MLQFNKILVVIFMMFSINIKVSESENVVRQIGQTIYYCNFDTGRVEKGIIKTFQTIAALDSTRSVIILENNLAIPERDVIGIWMPKMRCL